MTTVTWTDGETVENTDVSFKTPNANVNAIADLYGDSVGNASDVNAVQNGLTNTPTPDEVYAYDGYNNYEPHIRKYLYNDMEIARDYIEDYQEYKSVMSECNQTIRNTPYPLDGHVHCNATWDKMQCWGYVRAGETSYQPCPGYIRLSNPLAYAKKTCNSDGTWFRHPDTNRIWTNYTMCYDQALVDQHKQVLYMYFYGFSISIVLLIISLIIFSMFRQLKCVRVSLHKHLFVSYVLTGALWILYYALVPMNPDVLIANPIWCQVLHELTHYFTVCNYSWMFCEGFYLHALMVIAFTKDKKLLLICYLIGWAFPLLPTIIYTILRALNEEDRDRCWTGDTNLHWILAGPINISLVVIFIFSNNIMRILLSKIRSVYNNETMQTRRAVRATLILIPLLGLQYIAFPFKPPPGANGEYVYSMISAFLVSFQGVFVALVFCFFNGEVIKCFKKQYNRYKLQSVGRRRTFSGGSTSKFAERESMVRTKEMALSTCKTTSASSPLNKKKEKK
ncbi:calcitonin gene-related peptide type 1 receptor-like [Mya arenaria]|uniref:calcitonin gene-related peptide type 1 receptor-like n=1 Tax=Mya arenaria TaxID=6604 RepID=UPI0022E2B93B|nr:calcitonin gene-related peptide type 1 receptor-like [Mya arenaria]